MNVVDAPLAGNTTEATPRRTAAPPARPLRVLCVNHEGGRGGSSRSLFSILSHMDRGLVEPTVWSRRESHFDERYAALGIACRTVPELVSRNSRATLGNNLLAYLRFWKEFRKVRTVWRTLAEEISANFDLVHFNHDGLWLLARWLRRRVSLPFTFHIRTDLPDTVFATWQARAIDHVASHTVFITDNEMATYRRRGFRGPGTVVFNVLPEDTPTRPSSKVPVDSRFKVAVVGNFTWLRGIDRALEVAAALKARGRDDVLFVFAGETAVTDPSTGPSAPFLGPGCDLRDYARQLGVSEICLFLGHVTDPEAVLLACDVLAKPSRLAHPWSRDIIEAMALGRPVLATGTWSTFVEDDRTGYLFPSFDPEAMADAILRLAGDRALTETLGAQARERVARLCDGEARARDLLDVWQKATAADRAPTPAGRGR